MSEQTLPSAKAAKSDKAKAKSGKKAAKRAGKADYVKPPLPEDALSLAEAVSPPQSGPSAVPPFAAIPALSDEQRAQMEKLSMNLARAALTAQGAIAEMALRQADRP